MAVQSIQDSDRNNMTLNDEENIEYDEFVHMPPVKTWIARIKIKSIKKAKIQFIE